MIVSCIILAIAVIVAMPMTLFILFWGLHAQRVSDVNMHWNLEQSHKEERQNIVVSCNERIAQTLNQMAQQHQAQIMQRGNNNDEDLGPGRGV